MTESEKIAKSREALITSGVVLGTGMASRFMLNFREDIVSGIVSFVVLFLIFWAVPMWLRKYDSIRETKTTKFKEILKYCLIIFTIGALVSSIVKYCYFEYMKPAQFAAIINMGMEQMKAIGYQEDVLNETKPYLTALNYSIMEGVVNIVLSIPMAILVWFDVRQENRIRQMMGLEDKEDNKKDKEEKQ